MDNRQKLHENFLKSLGRNLLAYQMIESNLKVLLPFLEEKYNPERFKLATLGNLITQFIDRTKTGIIDTKEDTNFIKEEIHCFILDEFRELVQSRNNFVHQPRSLSQLPNTEKEYENQISELDSQYSRILAFNHYLDNFFFLVVTTMYKTHPESQELYQKYMDLKQNLPINTVFVDFDNPLETTWYKTKIVRYLLIAEKQLKNQDGMTSLSHAGTFIKQSDPSVTPQKYGLKKLTDVLIVSNLFDIYSCPRTNQRFYESKYPCISWNLKQDLEKEMIFIK